MARHIVQSDLWAKFKQEYGTPSVEAGGVVFTKHQIPLTGNYYAYCPRINPRDVDFEKLKEAAKAHECVAVNFDVPNVEAGTPEATNAEKLFLDHGCVKAQRDQFAKGNVLLDLTPSEEKLLENMHHKHRYNIGYAQRKGVQILRADSEKEFEDFYTLYKETAERQGYFHRSRHYIKKIFDIFSDVGKCEILTALYRDKPLASWLLLDYDGVLYYPYGGSSLDYRNYHGSTLLAWEAMRLGKQKECHTFDMWGTSVNVNNKDDSYYGFTSFKMKFGGRHVVYIDSYDLVINQPMYKMFNTANRMRWKMLNMFR